jgi:amino-acid N-acetyltransferase
MRSEPKSFVPWIRAAAPYIHALRGKTVVIAFGGEVVADETFLGVVHDLNLLHSLGTRLVVVHGSRPQIEAILKQQSIPSRYHKGLRITDVETMDCVLEGMGHARSRIEALLSLGLANSPMAGARIRVVGGNFITAKPIGVLDGIDMGLTGEVPRSSLPSSFSRSTPIVRACARPGLFADRGDLQSVGRGSRHTSRRPPVRAQVDLPHGYRRRPQRPSAVADRAFDTRRGSAARAAGQASGRCPALSALRRASLRQRCQARASDQPPSRRRPAAELFTRDGVGTMIAAAPLAHLRSANIDDVGGIIAIIEPLEEEGVLVRRSRERLEIEIERFAVAEHDGAIIGCAALYAFPVERAGELAALAVDPDFRREGYGEALLHEIEQRAKKLKLTRLFVLTTRASGWFLERGFVESDPARLPKQKRDLYNWQRRSLVYEKRLT